MTETRHSLNPEPRNVAVRVTSKKQPVYRYGQTYRYGDEFRVTEWVAASLVSSGLVERV